MPKTYKITAEKIGVHEKTVSEWVCSFKKIGISAYFFGFVKCFLRKIKKIWLDPLC